MTDRWANTQTIRTTTKRHWHPWVNYRAWRWKRKLSSRWPSSFQCFELAICPRYTGNCPRTLLLFGCLYLGALLGTRALLPIFMIDGLDLILETNFFMYVLCGKGQLSFVIYLCFVVQNQVPWFLFFWSHFIFINMFALVLLIQDQDCSSNYRHSNLIMDPQCLPNTFK